MANDLYDLSELKKQFGTPLYLYDVGKIKQNIRDYKRYFISRHFETEIIYASKALNIKEMIKIVHNEGISLDCVSVGEIYTALQVKFPTERIYYHGNNKSYDDLIFSLDNNIGTIVVDNLGELELLRQITNKRKQKVNILIRLNVGVSAHTHKYIVTAHVDSKFGILFGSEEYNKMIDIIDNSEFIQFLGFHSHIGSQIFDLNAFKESLKKLISYCKPFKQPLVLNIGGGFAVHYTDDDKPIPFTEIAKNLVKFAENIILKNGINIKKLCIEPGRSIVGEAGSTLYTIGYTKKTPSKEYYFVDGGMTDNIRPSLYQAKYDADIVGKEDLPKDKLVTVAGKCCESGDLILEDCYLQDAKQGDLLITYTTGAYGYSMSSNYNKMLIPALVFIENGIAKLAVKRQTYDQLLEREI